VSFVVYVFVGLAWSEVVPSPKSHEYVIGSPSGSDDPADEKCTVSGACPEVTSAAATATGARLAPARWSNR
jgi:hypothetical protein